MATEKIAITVDPTLLAGVERLRRRTGESRSAVFTRAIRELMGTREQEEAITRYVEAYRSHPEAPVEVEAAEALARESLRNLPDWEGE